MCPKNSKLLKMFRGHFLAPLNKLAPKKGKGWYWGAAEQKDFELAKEMLMKHATLAFPNFERPFDIYTDVSDYQLGITLVQDRKQLAFYTRNLNSAQLNYTVGEKELLGLIKEFKAFEGLVRSQELTVHTYHLNIC